MTVPTEGAARQRDDGPLAVLSSLPRSPVPPAAAAVAGVLPWLAVLGLVGGSGWYVPVGVALGWLLVAGAASSLRPATGRLDWLVVPLLHVAEYVGLARLGALAHVTSLDTAYALVAVVVMHHYDLIYRDGGRAQRAAGILAGGWPLRLLFAYAVAVAGVARPAFAVAAAWVFGVFAIEAIRTWEDRDQRDRMAVADVEEM